MKILAIETSCDETAAAVVGYDKNAPARMRIYSTVVASQDDLHEKFGGVVPELASRRHVEVLPSVVREAMDRSKMNLRELDGIAVTRAPGLMGALIVGLSYAKALAFTLNLPLIGVNHLAGHLAAVLLEDGDDLAWPHLGFIVSGGHTHLYLGQQPGNYSLLATTVDDAAGEAFDKVAKLMGLGYPGGRLIEERARAYEARKPKSPLLFELPMPRLKQGGLGFSFSGLKTAVAQYLRSHADYDLEAVCFLFQERVFDILAGQLSKAIDQHRPKMVIFCGGVAANRRLRSGLLEVCRRQGVILKAPSIQLCTDNAAMIGAAGLWQLKAGCKDAFDLRPEPCASFEAKSLSREFFPRMSATNE